jgi:predicted DsbA family dithiol-disulfide isomerase
MSAGRTRRNVIGIGVMGLGFVGLSKLRDMHGAQLEFRPLTRPAGFRRLVQGGAISSGAGGAVLAGLDAPGAARPAPFVPGVDGDLCAALFEDARAPGAASMAIFDDYRCPSCKVLIAAARKMAAAAPTRLKLHVHDWPVLGPVSERMARIARAAELQGAWRPMHDALSLSRFAPTDGWIEAMARPMGLSVPRLLRDMQGPEVARELARSASLAALFGFVGTPGIVIGRSVAVGALPVSVLSQLVRDERAAEGARCG